MALGDRIAVLNDGRLQQVGTPDELYRRPVNVFVAGFIGSPAMNLAHGHVEHRGDEVVLVLGSHRWPLPAHLLGRFPALSGSEGHPVIVGLRPSSLALAGDDDLADAPRICLGAISVESLGDEKNVLFMPPFEVPDVIGDSQQAESELRSMWTARVDPDAEIFTGQEVMLRLDLEHAYFFDATTGLTLAADTRQPALAS